MTSGEEWIKSPNYCVKTSSQTVSWLVTRRQILCPAIASCAELQTTTARSDFTDLLSVPAAQQTLETQVFWEFHEDSALLNNVWCRFHRILIVFSSIQWHYRQKVEKVEENSKKTIILRSRYSVYHFYWPADEYLKKKFTFDEIRQEEIVCDNIRLSRASFYRPDIDYSKRFAQFDHHLKWDFGVKLHNTLHSQKYPDSQVHQ